MCITLCITVNLYSVLNRHHHLRWSMECVLHCITHTVNLYSGLNQHHLRWNMECVIQFIYVLSCHLQWHMECALQCALQCIYVLPWRSIIWGEKCSVSVLQCICVLSCHLMWNIECVLQCVMFCPDAAPFEVKCCISEVCKECTPEQLRTDSGLREIVCNRGEFHSSSTPLF